MRHFYHLVLALAGAAALAFSSCVKAPELTLTSPTSIDLNVDGSSSAITFTANRDWSVRSSDSWVSVSPSSGTASDEAVTVRVSCSANTTYEDRTATITITMEELTQTVSVKQPANLGIVIPTQSYNLASDARSIEVEVKANVQYSVSISDKWIKQTETKGLTSSKLTFSVEENDTYDARSATITIKPQNATVQEQVISVKQAQKDALIVKDTSFDMPYGGGEIEVKVEANVSFDVKPSVDWIHYVETKALSSSTVRLTVDENATYSNREGKIEIKQKNGTLSHTLTVKQAGRIAVTSIELNKTSLTLKEGESETLTATVKPDNATDKTVTWSSSAPNIASVDEAGNVTAVAKGEATITAQAGEKTATCNVTISNTIIVVTKVSLNKTSLSLSIGERETLEATVLPEDATDKTVYWRSSDPKIATVDNKGTVYAIQGGTTFVTAQAGEKTATCSVFVQSDVEAVDLGLSVKWASCNLGATKPEGIGGYYAWGETSTKKDYSWSTYKWARHSRYDELTKYCTEYFYWNGEGSPDGKTVLDPEDDAAHVELGGGWRIPTKGELLELYSQCTWTRTKVNGVDGFIAQSITNGNSIFLPSTGAQYGTKISSWFSETHYWSSSLDTDNPVNARTLSFGVDDGVETIFLERKDRSCGLQIRPVSE